MEEEVIKKYKKAGEIAANALEFGKSLIKKEKPLVETLDKIEKKISSSGGKMAFPAQISFDDIAAHFCPEQDDTLIFGEQVVKLDLGVHIDGYIADTALTVDLSGNYSELVKASREALEAALKITKIGTTLGEVGEAIQSVITGYGFSPIRNLSGHTLDRFKLHISPSIPNINTNDKTELKEGQAMAIEPFASTGAGTIYESSNATIFMVVKKKPVRSLFTRQILKEIDSYEEMPFTKRWLTKKFSPAKVNFALRELLNLEIIKEFPPLPDKNHGIVSQAEDTVLVLDCPVIITKL